MLLFLEKPPGNIAKKRIPFSVSTMVFCQNLSASTWGSTKTCRLPRDASCMISVFWGDFLRMVAR